eukprot:TRINITY_DN61203_c0_g2_i1.p1 TRINITY_DN61203_c0_g2~~TRINITY_DN61203_c0_g2_i1.p1  ORF type:complete len:528 (+),score=3.58 TRINITY_DN61203_c0_g2_i1:64-1647(+)
MFRLPRLLRKITLKLPDPLGTNEWKLLTETATRLQPLYSCEVPHAPGFAMHILAPYDGSVDECQRTLDINENIDAEDEFDLSWQPHLLCGFTDRSLGKRQFLAPASFVEEVAKNAARQGEYWTGLARRATVVFGPRKSGKTTVMRLHQAIAKHNNLETFFFDHSTGTQSTFRAQLQEATGVTDVSSTSLIFFMQTVNHHLENENRKLVIYHDEALSILDDSEWKGAFFTEETAGNIAHVFTATGSTTLLKAFGRAKANSFHPATCLDWLGIPSFADKQAQRTLLELVQPWPQLKDDWDLLISNRMCSFVGRLAFCGDQTGEDSLVRIAQLVFKDNLEAEALIEILSAQVQSVLRDFRRLIMGLYTTKEAPFALQIPFHGAAQRQFSRMSKDEQEELQYEVVASGRPKFAANTSLLQVPLTDKHEIGNLIAPDGTLQLTSRIKAFQDFSSRPRGLQKYDVFLCHAAPDKHTMIKVRNLLQELHPRISVFLDDGSSAVLLDMDEWRTEVGAIIRNPLLIRSADKQSSKF